MHTEEILSPNRQLRCFCTGCIYYKAYSFNLQRQHSSTKRNLLRNLLLSHPQARLFKCGAYGFFYWAFYLHVCECVHVMCKSKNSSNRQLPFNVSSDTEVLSQAAHGGRHPQIPSAHWTTSLLWKELQNAPKWTLPTLHHVDWPKGFCNTQWGDPKNLGMIHFLGITFLQWSPSFGHKKLDLCVFLFFHIFIDFLLLLYYFRVITCVTMWGCNIDSVLRILCTWFISTISHFFWVIPAIPVRVSGVDQQLYWEAISLCSHNYSRRLKLKSDLEGEELFTVGRNVWRGEVWEWGWLGKRPDLRHEILWVHKIASLQGRFFLWGGHIC